MTSKKNSFLTYLSLDQYSLPVLFINFSYTDKKQLINDRLKDAVFVDWADFQVIDGNVLVKKKSLDTFSFVFVGVVGDNADLYSTVLTTLQIKNIKHIKYGVSPERCNKILQSVNLRLNDVPQIKTIIAQANRVSAMGLISELKLPVISKIIHGSQGRGVKKHDTKEELATHLTRCPTELFIFQEFIPNDGDYRIFFIRSKLIYAVRRKSVKNTEFRNNVSLGGEKEKVELDSLATSIAINAHETMKFDISGVDLIQHSVTKEWFVMEVNAAPQFSDEFIKPVIEEIVSIINNP